MRAVQIDEFGGPEVLELVDLPAPVPGDGELLVDVSTAGLNFADIHQREDSYIAKYELPLVLGGEVAGTDPGGRRVISLLRSGGYAEQAAARSDQTFPIPDGLEDGAALALLQSLAVFRYDHVGQFLGGGLVAALVEGDLAALDQVHPVAHLEHLAVVVRDDDDRNVALGLEPGDEVEDD